MCLFYRTCEFVGGGCGVDGGLRCRSQERDEPGVRSLVNVLINLHSDSHSSFRLISDCWESLSPWTVNLAQLIEPVEMVALVKS